MAISLGLAWVHPSSNADRPHYLGHATARTVADDPILEVWNGPTDSSQVLRINKDGAVHLQVGSAAAPVLAPEEDKDTGIYFVTGTPEVAFSVAGSKVFSIVAEGPAVTGALTVGRINPASGGGLGVNVAGDDIALARIGGSFTSGGSGVSAAGLAVTPDLTAAAGDTGELSLITNTGGSITTQGQSETIDTVAGAWFNAPTITVGSGDTVTNAATVHIKNVPTEGVNNYGLWVDDGVSRFDGDVQITTAGTAAASAVTVGGTQTLTSKTLTSPTLGGSPSAPGATWSNLGSVATVDINGGTIGSVTLDGTLLGTPVWGSPQAITLSTATQGSVTSLGTLLSLVVNGAVSVTTTNGIDVNPGSDVDADILTVGVTGSPKLSWDESEDKFLFSHTLAMEQAGVDHGITSNSPASTSTVGYFEAVNAATGGLSLYALAEDDAAAETTFRLTAVGGQADTTKTASGDALVEIWAAEQSGGGLSDIAAAGSVLAVKGRVSSSWRTLFLVDEDGDFYYDGADGGAYDTEDDVHLARALALATAPRDVIRDEFDDFVKYNEDDLVRLGILGAPVSEGGLVNGANVDRLLIGAVWQQAQEIQRLRSDVLALTAG